MKAWGIRAAFVSVAFAATLGAQQNSEEFARRQFDSGASFMQNHRYAEALKDFQAVLDSFPKSSVADNALLQVALYHLDIAHDTAASQAAIDRLLKDYPDTDSAPMAHVVAGRIALAKGRTPADIDAALASFERVPRLFPNDDAVPAAGFYAADALRTVRRLDEALDRFRRVSMEYPRSVWSARARLGASLCLAVTDRAPAALEELQRVRQQLPGSPEAADALNLNTILYRLYVRLPAQSAYAFSNRFAGTPETAKYKDVFGIMVDASGRLLLGHKLGVTVFDPKGALAQTLSADDPSAFFIDSRDRIVVVRHETIIPQGGADSVSIKTPTQDGKGRLVEEIPAALAMSGGDRLISDAKGKTVIRVSASGTYIGKFASLNVERMALNYLDDVAMIDRDTKSIAIVDRDGKALGKIPSKGTGYEFDNPIGVTFDAFGHLYVLDRGRASVFVFGPKNRLLTTVTIPEKAAGAFQKATAFALDKAGRLFIYDDRVQGVQVYQ